MDSILVDAGGPVGVVHRIGDLLSVFLEKRLVITLMTPVEIKSLAGKRPGTACSEFSLKVCIEQIHPVVTKKQFLSDQETGRPKKSAVYRFIGCLDQSLFDFRIPCFLNRLYAD